MQRRNNKDYIYGEAEDKEQFLGIVADLAGRLDFSVLYYTLMDNHYHMLLETGDDSLSMVMQRLNLTYTRYYNKRHNRINTIYGGRYLAVQMTNNTKFLHTVRYIAYNPVRAGMVRLPKEYHWSAHDAIMDNSSSFVARDKTLARFSSDSGKALQRYIACVEEPAWMAPGDAIPVIVDRYPDARECLARLLGIMELTETEKRLITSGVRNSSVADARNVFSRTAHEEGFALRDIAEFLCVSYETVRRAVRNEREI